MSNSNPAPLLSNQAVKMLESREKATPSMFGELLRNASMGDLRDCPVRHVHKMTRQTLPARRLPSNLLLLPVFHRASADSSFG